MLVGAAVVSLIGVLVAGVEEDDTVDVLWVNNFETLIKPFADFNCFRCFLIVSKINLIACYLRDLN